MSQSASAFGSIQDGLSFFRNAYDQFAGYRAAIIRLHGLVVANEEGRALPEVTTTALRRRHGCNSTMSRSARPTESSSSSRSTCAWKSATHW